MSLAWRAGKVVVGVVLGVATAQACGPDFSADVFVRRNRPDLPGRYVAGQLGLLQTGFARADLFVAYRYLNGGTLDAEEQKGWSATYSAEQEQEQRPDVQVSGLEAKTVAPIAEWGMARAKFPGAPPGPIAQDAPQKVKMAGGYEYDASYLNCADDAFRQATRTLAARAKQWGAESPALGDWLRGQDVVFSNCGGGTLLPAAAPQGSVALLVKDRAYQTAAAALYAGRFEEAAASFEAIGRDAGSPWQPGAGYLAARAMVREAFLSRLGAQSPADYDSVPMRAAEVELRAVLANQPPPQWRKAAEAELALVRARVEPEQRAKELGALVAGPGHDAGYAQDLQDLLWVADAHTPDGLRAAAYSVPGVPDAAAKAEAVRRGAYDGAAMVRRAAPIVDWALTVQSLSAEAPDHALAEWRRTRSLPWMVAALVLSPGAGAGKEQDLLQAAAGVAAGSPGWETVRYNRARLLLAAGRVNDARTELGVFAQQMAQMPVADREPSTRNALGALQMLQAPTVKAFLTSMPQTMVETGSEEASSVRECMEVMEHSARQYGCVERVGGLQIDPVAAGVLNGEAPLGVWLEAAQAQGLPAQMRGAIAMEGWTRAVLLGDGAKAEGFARLLPAELQAQAARGGELGVWMTLARNPGLRPYVNSGTQRAYSYDFVESYRDNWCYAPDLREDHAAALPAAVFLHADERAQGKREAGRLGAMRAVAVGQHIVREVEGNPSIPGADEALYLVLRMIRYGCVEPAQVVPPVPGMTYSPEAQMLLALKLEVGRLMRAHYKDSPWTKKAAPFVG